ncbi:hypothetical protein QQ045_009846 [Rhodiola kirilowii]
MNEVAEVINKLPLCKTTGPDVFNSEFLRPIGESLVQIWCAASGAFSGQVLYRQIISALLANRLKPILSYLIDHAQSAFEEGRNTSYNMSLVQELLCHYRRRKVSKRCMLKIDISKAYDMVNWDFLWNTMELFDFPVQFVNWIRACVTTKFSVMINGGMEGNFVSNRGLRKGDPISPYLFTMVMEILSRILRRLRGSDGFKFHPKCSRISLTHLMFADDVIIFSKPNLESLAKMKDALRTFYKWSGLKVSEEKSYLYFGGCTEAEETRLAGAVGVQQGQLPFMYLGVPLDGSILKSAALNSVIGKITNKIKSWSAKFLSYAGRLVLVKHVLSAISSYWMRVIIFPKGVLKKITTICRNYLWSGSSLGRRSLVAWKEVCCPKEEGGLGIKRLWEFNKGLSMGMI